MSRRTGSWGRGLLLSIWLVPALFAEPLATQPDNPRVLVFRGQPTVLVGSGEHYGAVLNPDFDYRAYLKTLAADGLNLTRVFVGPYLEKPGDFGISNNTLAPAAGRALLPWARSDQPGFRLGGPRFDLDRWDERFFERLRSFVSSADALDVVVEVTFFTSYYGEGWPRSPFHVSNNVNGVGDLPKERVNTLDNGPLRGYQEALVRRVVGELAEFDNVYYEVQNEPWADHPRTVEILSPYIEPHEMTPSGAYWQNRVDLADAESLRWQAWIAEVVADAESRVAARHLIAQNYANFSHPLEVTDPRIAIVNFHYARPEAALLNQGLGRVISFDESGFAGREDPTYRRQAWEFLLSGGSIFSHLDYSFAVGHEDGTATDAAPGGGSPALRHQLGVLKRFLNALDLPALAPRPELVRSAPGAYVRCLAAEGQQYALYLFGGGTTQLALRLPPGAYRVAWIDPSTGKGLAVDDLEHPGGECTLSSPRYDLDVALRLDVLGATAEH